MARRAGVRLHARLRARHGRPRARGDRPAPPPQPRRHVVGGDEPAQAGLAVDGDDARDHLASAVRGEGQRPLRLTGQGPRGPHPGPRGRGPALGAVHDRAADRHRREPHRAGGVDLRAAPGGPAVRPRPGSHHPELPGQARHRDAAHRRPRARRVPRRDRRLPHRARPEDAGPGAAQPRRPRGVHRPARRRHRRLGRGLAPDPGPREPRAALAVAGPAPLDHGHGRLHPAGQADRPPGVRRGWGALDRPPRLCPRGGTRRRRRPRPRGRPAAGPALARARRRLRERRPHRPPRGRGHRGPDRRPPLRLRLGVRRLGSCARRRGGRGAAPPGRRRALPVSKPLDRGGLRDARWRSLLQEPAGPRSPRGPPPPTLRARRAGRPPSATPATSATSTRSP